ncbi:MAG TPA: hypothetical protein VN381_04220, partial [Anaerovoracaceae bacterium]|nr:hypothetical protein [Anaerovoracaceae bacterium]
CIVFKDMSQKWHITIKKLIRTPCYGKWVPKMVILAGEIYKSRFVISLHKFAGNLHRKLGELVPDGTVEGKNQEVKIYGSYFNETVA